MYKKSFTLIEMLIVVIIIGILATALIPRIQDVQSRARDAKRIGDVRQLGTALALYKQDTGSYPKGSFSTEEFEAGRSHALVPTYLTSIPKDSIDDPIPSGFGGTSFNGINPANDYEYYSGGYYHYFSFKFLNIAIQKNIPDVMGISTRVENIQNGNWVINIQDIMSVYNEIYVSPNFGVGDIFVQSWGIGEIWGEEDVFYEAPLLLGDATIANLQKRLCSKKDIKPFKERDTIWEEAGIGGVPYIQREEDTGEPYGMLYGYQYVPYGHCRLFTSDPLAMRYMYFQ